MHRLEENLLDEEEQKMFKNLTQKDRNAMECEARKYSRIYERAVLKGPKKVNGKKRDQFKN